MFNKVLIANRGEIACRIIRTLKRLGVSSVAIYSEPDRHSRHVLDADEAYCVGPAQASHSYLNQDAILKVALAAGAEAIHPGYGFLSENTTFAARAEAQGVRFVGPTPEQIRQFGLKHVARELAERVGVPLLPGSGILTDLAQAELEAERIGYPVMLKSSAGGGGIGMQVCASRAQLKQAFDVVQRLSQNNFGSTSVFLERFVEQARHIEVQIFGDGKGRVLALGERDCSAQRRNQKVIEETPAPGLSDSIRRSLEQAATLLTQAVAYRSAGTVEFVFDVLRSEFYFLEVNTRLQVEHGVTEAVTGIDLVEWMLLVAAGSPPDLSKPITSCGHAIEVRLYAEDPARDFRPSAGLLTEVKFPAGVRCDSWIERGSEVSAFYDPLLAKLVVHEATRELACARLERALADTRISGIETNTEYLRSVVVSPVFARGEMTTQVLKNLSVASETIEVLAPGTHSLIQDYPGRIGYWAIGVPPSGPMDSLALRLANRVVGNQDGVAALELTVQGPKLLFGSDAVVALAGARMRATLDGHPAPYYTPIAVKRGQVLELGSIEGPGVRTYLAVRGSFDVPAYLGSSSTFTLGGFGGHGGRALRKGDVLHIGSHNPPDAALALDPALIPKHSEHWEIGVLYGPHGAPDFFTERDILVLFESEWKVHYNSARTGVRLIGPKPEWARADGGEAGLHPSNIHDVAYAIGAIDFTGDMPIILGPDGPSLGGFVCPATVVSAELWKLGQLRPGNTVRFVPCAEDAVHKLAAARVEQLATRAPVPATPLLRVAPEAAICREKPATATEVRVVYRRAGDRYLLIEYGPLVLDLKLRFRVHALMQHLEALQLAGIIDLTPGIRSLQVHFDPTRLSAARLLDLLQNLELELPAVSNVEVPTRIVHLPLSWDDPATRLAIEKYMQSVRADAPWTPSNIEFIRRINGLESVDEVKRIVFDASYLVLGLGDVYLGAPVATPIDPRHRLVTTKYNPARTWTPENAVGIGGAYLCVYGMEGPGGYQFVGRTLQMYNRFRRTPQFGQGTPWLLRFFDQIRFYPVSSAELLEMREAFPVGRAEVKIEETVFRLADYDDFLTKNASGIAEFTEQRQKAFNLERERWSAQGGLSAELPELAALPSSDELKPGYEAIESHVSGSVWKVLAKAGAQVHPGDPLFIIESMKMEVTIEAASRMSVESILVAEGSAVESGQRLAVLRPPTAL